MTISMRVFRAAIAFLLTTLLSVGTAASVTAASPADTTATPTATTPTATTPTTVTVRVLSNDAKLLQDPVGGARVVIRDAETGEVLAQGEQTGNSGSTKKIMLQPHERGAAIYEAPGAGVFEATIPLSEPTRVIVTAEGPLDYPDSMQMAAASATLIPGQDITGDGLVLTLHGFIVEILSPENGSADGEEMTVRARVRMLCGCPTEPGGLWDSDRYEIRAELINASGTTVSTVPLTFTGTTNEFGATVKRPGGEVETLRVVVSDAERVNFGTASTSL